MIWSSTKRVPTISFGFFEGSFSDGFLSFELNIIANCGRSFIQGASQFSLRDRFITVFIPPRSRWSRGGESGRIKRGGREER